MPRREGIDPTSRSNSRHWLLSELHRRLSELRRRLSRDPSATVADPWTFARAPSASVRSLSTTVATLSATIPPPTVAAVMTVDVTGDARRGPVADESPPVAARPYCRLISTAVRSHLHDCRAGDSGDCCYRSDLAFPIQTIHSVCIFQIIIQASLTR